MNSETGLIVISGQHAPFDVDRNLRILSVVGRQRDLFLDIAGRGFPRQPGYQLVVGRAADAAHVDQLQPQIRVVRAGIDQTPLLAAGVRNLHPPLGDRPQIDVAEVDRSRLHHHVAADEAGHLQLHFGVRRLVEVDRHRGRAGADELPRVQLGHDLAGFERFQVGFDHLRRRAIARRGDARDVDFLLVDVLDLEAVDALGPPHDRPEIVLGRAEHLDRPFLRRDGRGGEQGEEHRSKKLA